MDTLNSSLSHPCPVSASQSLILDMLSSYKKNLHFFQLLFLSNLKVRVMDSIDYGNLISQHIYAQNGELFYLYLIHFSLKYNRYSIAQPTWYHHMAMLTASLIFCKRNPQWTSSEKASDATLMFSFLFAWKSCWIFVLLLLSHTQYCYNVLYWTELYEVSLIWSMFVYSVILDHLSL